MKHYLHYLLKRQTFNLPITTGSILHKLSSIIIAIKSMVVNIYIYIYL
jgi:hypothetical protein